MSAISLAQNTLAVPRPPSKDFLVALKEKYDFLPEVKEMMNDEDLAPYFTTKSRKKVSPLAEERQGIYNEEKCDARVWKEKKAKRLLAEKMALQKAETLKKKGKSVLTGRDLYLVQKDVFVDDAEATEDYTRQVVQDEDADLYDENGALIEDAERPASAVSVDGVKVDAALYGDDDDLDDLDDLDDD